MEKKSKLALIVAYTPRGEIGYKNTIPWKLSGDLPRFKKLTMDSVIISGRTTHETLPAVMEGRIRIVLTRSPEYASEVHDSANNIYGVSSMDEALELARSFNKEWIFFIGGATVYEEALPIVETAFVTLVHKEAPKYDTRIKGLHFPASDWAKTCKEIVLEPHPKYSEFDILSHTYYIFERIEQEDKSTEE